MKLAIVYSSVHHDNTKKVAEAIKGKTGAELIRVQEIKDKDLSQYDMIGIASGIYMGKCHEQIRKFIEENPALSENKKVFLLITSGSNSKKYGLSEQLCWKAESVTF